jgi:hypothetical protein
VRRGKNLSEFGLERIAHAQIPFLDARVPNVRRS